MVKRLATTARSVVTTTCSTPPGKVRTGSEFACSVGTRTYHYGFGVRIQDFGFGVWCLVFGVWCLMFGVWCLVFGVWCLVFGV